MKFVVLPELKGRWVWELRSSEGPIVSKSPRSFATKAETIAAIDTIWRAVSRAGTCDLVGICWMARNRVGLPAFRRLRWRSKGLEPGTACQKD